MSNGNSGLEFEGAWNEGNAPRSPETPVADILDEVFDSLSATRRRYLLYYALSADEADVDLDDAVAAVERYESAGTEGVDDPDATEIRVELHHNHLPRLDEAGVLDYDPQRAEIRFTGHAPLRQIVEHARRLELD